MKYRFEISKSEVGDGYEIEAISESGWRLEMLDVAIDFAGDFRVFMPVNQHTGRRQIRVYAGQSQVEILDWADLQLDCNDNLTHVLYHF